MLPVGDRRTELRYRRGLELRGYRFKYQHAGIACVPQIRRGGVGDEGRFVVAVEIATVGEFHVHRADYSERHANDSYGLADGGLSAEQFLLQPCAEKDHSAPLGNILRAN